MVFHGADFDEAREHCEKQATEQGYRYIHSGNEPSLIAGVATCTVEVLQAQPDTEVIVVPVGGGSGAAGACVVAKAVRRSIEVIGVQSEAAPAAYQSWRAGTLVADTTSTFAEGLATRTAFELPQRIMRDLLDGFVLVAEDALRAATRVMIGKTRNLVEPAGAAALAAVIGAPSAVRRPEGGDRLQRRQPQPRATSSPVAVTEITNRRGCPPGISTGIRPCPAR